MDKKVRSAEKSCANICKCEKKLYLCVTFQKTPSLRYIYENLVAQLLTATGQKLFYYTFPTEDGKRLYEVDFLMSHGGKLWPIEVKSSGYNSHHSLDEFCKKYSSRVEKRFLITTKDYSHDKGTILLPMYMTHLLR